MMLKVLACSWLFLFFSRSSEGAKEVVDHTTEAKEVVGHVPGEEKKVVFAEPDRSAVEARAKKMGSDYAYGDIDTEHPLKTRPDKTNFEFNVSFYADADHYDEDPASLEKELNEMIPTLDAWVDSLTEPGVFSVKLHYTLKRIFARGDPDRIDYNHKASFISPNSITGPVAALLTKTQRCSSTRHPLKMSARIHELGVGFAKANTMKWNIEGLLKKTGAETYKFRSTVRQCQAEKRGCDVIYKVAPGAPLPHFAHDAAEEIGNLDMAGAPTPAMVQTVFNRNKTAYQTEFMGVTAHELGHILGAGERRNIRSVDDNKKDWDVMLTGFADGSVYGDTSKYAIFVNIACEMLLTYDFSIYRSLNIYARDCRIPSKFYTRRMPWSSEYHPQNKTPSSQADQSVQSGQLQQQNRGDGTFVRIYPRPMTDPNWGRQNGGRWSNAGGRGGGRGGGRRYPVRIVNQYGSDYENGNGTTDSPVELEESTKAYLISVNETGQEKNLMVRTVERTSKNGEKKKLGKGKRKGKGKGKKPKSRKQ